MIQTRLQTISYTWFDFKVDLLYLPCKRTNTNKMNEIVKIFEKNKGYARMVELKKANIHTRRIANAVERGIIEKIKPGLYKLVNYEHDEHE